MTDRPILFSGSMIRALLAGTKTQTRRVLKPLPRRTIFFDPKTAGKDQFQGPRFRPGDRLWVRETWTHTGTGVWDISSARLSGRSGVHYRADGDILGAAYFPSIFLPREFSRLTLYVTDVRVERLQDISEADARAEGFEPDEGFRDVGIVPSARGSFARYWAKLHGISMPRKPTEWAANPWVAAYTFVPRLGNIDTLPATLEEAA